MIELQRVERPDDRVMERLLPLYEEAFPVNERRDAGQLRRMIGNRDSMYFNAIRNDGRLAGLYVYWDLGDFHYIEHLAVLASCRGRGVGTRVLEYTASHLTGSRLLEVEPASRQVAFYERQGYTVLDREYVQPPYDDRRQACPLWIMGNERPGHLAGFVERVKREVYEKNRNI
jgi:ribosomal protein S18 acetylase RimI-like enzyme